jgi:gas vesicle protein
MNNHEGDDSLASDGKNKDLLVGAIVGTVIGAVTALLFAPKSGRELRKDIVDGVHQVSEKTQHTAESIADKTKQLAETLSERTQQAAKAVNRQKTEWVEKAKETAGTWRSNKSLSTEEAEPSLTAAAGIQEEQKIS